MAEIAIYVDSVSSTSASGRLNVYNAGPSMGATAYGHIFRDLYTRIGSSSGAGINQLVSLNWSTSGLSPGTTYDLDAWMSTSTSTPSNFFSGSNAVYATSVSFTTTAAAPSWSDQSITSSARVGYYYSSSISANNATSYSYSGLPPGISQNSSGSRFISGYPTTSGFYNVSFTATGPGGSISGSDSISVARRYPTWSDSTVSTSMRQGQYYSDGVSANYVSYYGSSGSIPPGLSFSTSNGSFSGTPSTPGTYTFAFQAYNVDGEGIGTSNFSVTVKHPLATWIDDQISTAFTIDVPYSDSISANNANSYEVSSGNLPDGVSLNSSNGSLSGTPNTAGSFSFTLAAVNGSNEKIYTQNYSVTVNDPGGRFFVYDGSSWVERDVESFNGTSWKRAVVYYYDGANWQRSLD